MAMMQSIRQGSILAHHRLLLHATTLSQSLWLLPLPSRSSTALISYFSSHGELGRKVASGDSFVLRYAQRQRLTSCFEDGKYSVDFYTSHPSDSHMNAVNQRYWLRYHSRSDLMGPCPPSDTHLIRPTDTSEAYASRHNLLPFRQYVNLTHSNTFIHGLFDFEYLVVVRAVISASSILIS